jgi:hypothetical protein
VNLQLTIDLRSRGPVDVTAADDGGFHLRLGADSFEAMARVTPDAADQLTAVAQALRQSGGRAVLRCWPDAPPWDMNVTAA